MKKQTQYFINGLILLIIGMLLTTIIPKFVNNIEKYIFVEIEFFTLCASAIFYLFSPKYYKYQILSIFLAIIYYLTFCKFFLQF